MRTTLSALTVLGVLATLTGCTDEPDPDIARDTHAYTRAVMAVTHAVHNYKLVNDTSRVPLQIIQKGDTYIAGSSPKLYGSGDRSPAASGVRLEWFYASGTSYFYCLETGTTHFSAVGGDNVSNDRGAKTGSCPAEPEH